VETQWFAISQRPARFGVLKHSVMKCVHCELKSTVGTPDGATEGEAIGASVIGAFVGVLDGNIEGVSDGV